ncbi:hypothetical protein ACIHFC_19045 [Streptomyces sp. NPDC052013]|uniref:hypothetical protein n=1 Tax=Streptomyces sp. NPDC052013 TaxID=3365679 RepID=UPI0037CD09B9
MSEQNKNTQAKNAAAGATASKARQATDKATAPAEQAAKNAGSKATDTASAAASGTQRAAQAAEAAAQSAVKGVEGAAQTAVKGVEAGRRAVVATSGQVAAGAKTAWTVIANRKLVAAGVGAGLTALSAASYAVGRRAERHAHGPLTRMTGGRI